MITPSPSQIAIGDANDLGMVIVAPAGCGKTEALALRVAGLIERGAVEHPRRILVATFTNRARDNVKGRLTSYLSPPTMRDRVTVANFHGLSARIVRAHAAVIGMNPDWALPESDWVRDQCRNRALSFSDSTSVQDLLRTIKQQALTDSEVAHRLENASNTNATEIEQLRKSEQQLTYDDLPRIAELILTNDTVAQLYQNHFAAVVVDEFQDLTPQQLRIINKIGHSRTTYAGDLAQGIYGFAGAQPNSVYERIRNECAREVVITDSHRSSPAVLAMVNSLAHRTGGTQLSSFDPSSWPLGGLGGRIDFQSTADEANWVIGFVQKVLDHAPNHRIGVIARTGPRRRFVDYAFAMSEIAHHRWDDGLLDTETAKVIKAMLMSMDLAEFHAAPNTLDLLRELAGLNMIQDPPTRTALAEALVWCDEALTSDSSLAEVRSRVRIGDTSTLLTTPGAHLLTGHVGKGQQFDWVVVVGAEDGCIPDWRATTDEKQQEEARVLGVMLSRARHGVVVLHSARVEAASTGVAYSKSPSRFLTDFDQVDEVKDSEGVDAWLQSAPWEQIATR